MYNFCVELGPERGGLRGNDRLAATDHPQFMCTLVEVEAELLGFNLICAKPIERISPLGDEFSKTGARLGQNWPN